MSAARAPAAPAFAERRVEVGGAGINYVEAGSGDPPILLVHGLGSAAVKFYDTLTVLGGVRRTIAIDLPGFGRSDAPRGSYAPGWMAGALRGFLDALGIERAIVAGNSYGGLVSMYLAAAWPERVAGLTLAAPVLPNDGPPGKTSSPAMFVAGSLPGIGPLAHRLYWQREPSVVVAESLFRNCADASRIPEHIVRLLEEDAARRARSRAHRFAGVQAQRQVLWAVTGRRETTWRVLRSLRVPTVLLWGDRDEVLPIHIGERAVRELPGAHLIVLDDVGHNPQMEKPEEFAAAVTAFARSLEARA